MRMMAVFTLCKLNKTDETVARLCKHKKEFLNI